MKKATKSKRKPARSKKTKRGLSKSGMVADLKAKLATSERKLKNLLGTKIKNLTDEIAQLKEDRSRDGEAEYVQDLTEVQLQKRVVELETALKEAQDSLRGGNSKGGVFWREDADAKIEEVLARGKKTHLHFAEEGPFNKKYKKSKNMGPLKPGCFFVKFDFETVDECIGSYGVEETKTGDVTKGLGSIEEAIQAGKDTYKDDPDGIPAFEVLNSELVVVAIHPAPTQP
jgi:hypothetical protein